MTAIEDRYDHVIVGAGMAAAKAVEGIRSTGSTATVAIFGAEPVGPLYRPDLSKTLWLQADATVEGTAMSTESADLHTSTAVTGIDPQAHRITLADGTTVGYGSVLLATGSQPRTAGIDAGERVIYYRTAADFRALREVATPGAHVIVVGGGYIGSELAAALTLHGVEVTYVIDGDLVQQSMFPTGLARAITDDFIGHGVRLVHGRLAGGRAGDSAVNIDLADGTTLTADAVVIGIGASPRVDLARAAGLTIDEHNGGVVVDDHLRTSAPDVYAAGDIASYPDVRLGRRRVEHANAAESQGETAGRTMAGTPTAYTHTPFFWSDLFDAGYEAIGEIRSDHEVVEDWTDATHGTGVVYYLDGGAVRGVLLWNVWDSVPMAQELIESTATEPITDPAALRGRIELP